MVTVWTVEKEAREMLNTVKFSVCQEDYRDHIDSLRGFLLYNGLFQRIIGISI